MTSGAPEPKLTTRFRPRGRGSRSAPGPSECLHRVRQVAPLQLLLEGRHPQVVRRLQESPGVVDHVARQRGERSGSWTLRRPPSARNAAAGAEQRRNHPHQKPSETTSRHHVSPSRERRPGDLTARPRIPAARAPLRPAAGHSRPLCNAGTAGHPRVDGSPARRPGSAALCLATVVPRQRRAATTGHPGSASAAARFRMMRLRIFESRFHHPGSRQIRNSFPVRPGGGIRLPTSVCARPAGGASAHGRRPPSDRTPVFPGRPAAP